MSSTQKVNIPTFSFDN